MTMRSMEASNGTKVHFYCMYIPFCDARDCDRDQYGSPVDCPGCNRGMVALHFTILILMALFITMGNLGIILVIKRLVCALIILLIANCFGHMLDDTVMPSV